MALRVNPNPHFSLNDELENTKFGVRVIHCTNPQMAVVQVYYLDKMVAVAHTIGREHLPSKELVRMGLVAW